MMPGMNGNHRSSVSAAPRPGQVALYRFYDAHEELLYVGVSNDPRRRWKEHAQSKPWYPQVHHQALTWYDSEASARRAESRAIRQERPQFNIAGALRPARARLAIPAYLWPSVLLAGLGLFLTLTDLRGAELALRDPLAPVADAVFVALVALLLAALLVAAAPRIRRFGAWIERNSVSHRRESA